MHLYKSDLFDVWFCRATAYLQVHIFSGEKCQAVSEAAAAMHPDNFYTPWWWNSPQQPSWPLPLAAQGTHVCPCLLGKATVSVLAHEKLQARFRENKTVGLIWLRFPECVILKTCRHCNINMHSIHIAQNCLLYIMFQLYLASQMEPHTPEGHLM